MIKTGLSICVRLYIVFGSKSYAEYYHHTKGLLQN